MRNIFLKKRRQNKEEKIFPNPFLKLYLSNQAIFPIWPKVQGKILTSRVRKKLLKRNKKHFSSFLKGFKLVFFERCESNFKIQKKLANYFAFKDWISKELTPGVIYKFQCGLCNKSHYRECIRHLKIGLLPSKKNFLFALLKILSEWWKMFFIPS